MLGAAGIVDAEALAQRIEAGALAGEFLARHRDGVDVGVAQLALAGPLELGVEEADVELRVVDHQLGIGDEFQELLDPLAEARLVGQELVAQAVHVLRAGRHDHLGIEIGVEGAAGGDGIDQLDAADLDDAMAGQRIEAGGFGVENDFAHAGLLKKLPI